MMLIVVFCTTSDDFQISLCCFWDLCATRESELLSFSNLQTSAVSSYRLMDFKFTFWLRNSKLTVSTLQYKDPTQQSTMNSVETLFSIFHD